ncbi:MBOAT family O-acyltransferase [Papillibacter cinnamivorans]|uniref:Alginate O-acetyltransferase complex protein AlgI n=1 Tax=Papillibacter cinnamivorans DSM 12816 TaxID=1122930 RepID=A0A1W2BST8_9FIRM|nr:MBOAT family protein [Papillibacter cinnamivorans]SMC76013.1 alginate O-acetyltransferase complex protein AlgI [Papillibacter cinnamivorans DSM 12816]
MLFSSAVFLFVFLPCVLAGYYILFRWNRTLQNVFLLLASLFFYAWGEPWFVLVMIASILVNYGFGLWVSVCRTRPRAARLAITAMLAVNLGILFVYKYLGFTVRNINLLFSSKLSVPSLVLPIGISFFTFQAISYVLDVYRGRGEAQKNPLNVGLYISFFPQLIAGPIVKYETVAQQIRDRKETWEDFSAGVCRFILGLGKKVLLANTLALVAEKAFNLGGGNLSVSFAWMGALAYTFQIYFDFSGYSDMAIGLGRMFGFHFLENFNYPYISRSITEFWRRWHISLSTWFRDYVYFPLGGSRVQSKARLVFNLFVVWLLTGIWHGANWTFICWGLFYFILITAEKLTGFDRRLQRRGFLPHLYTMLLVVCGWVMFRADSMAAAAEYLKAMFGLQGNGLWDANTMLYVLENRWFFPAAVLFSLPTAKWLGARFSDKPVFGFLYAAGLLLILAVSVSYIIKGSYNPFIYFNF